MGSKYFLTDDGFLKWYASSLCRSDEMLSGAFRLRVPSGEGDHGQTILLLMSSEQL